MNRKAQTILDATIRLFLGNGAKKTTMDEIAEAAGASKVTVYKYFSDKDTLYLHAGRQMLAEAAQALRAAPVSDVPLSRKFQAALDAVAAFADSGRYALCRELAAFGSALNAELTAYRETYRDALYALIDEGIAAGYMKPGLDRDMMIYSIDMGVQYYQQNEAYRLRMRGDSTFRSRYMRFFISNVFADDAAVLPKE